MKSERLNLIIGVCIITITVIYARSMRQLNKDTREFNSAMDEFVAQLPLEEQ